MRQPTKGATQFEACKKLGFVQFEWHEPKEWKAWHSSEEWDLVEDQSSENYGHYAIAEIDGITFTATVHHLKPKGRRFKVVVAFRCQSEFGDLSCITTPPTVIYNLKDAFEYAQWQATLILRLSKGLFSGCEEPNR